jgi:hypothetical protein
MFIASVPLTEMKNDACEGGKSLNNLKEGVRRVSLAQQNVS